MDSFKRFHVFFGVKRFFDEKKWWKIESYQVKKKEKIRWISFCNQKKKWKGKGYVLFNRNRSSPVVCVNSFVFLLFAFLLSLDYISIWKMRKFKPFTKSSFDGFFFLSLSPSPTTFKFIRFWEREREREYRINVVVVVRSKINGNFSSIFFFSFSFRVSVDRLHWIHFISIQ